MANLSNPPPDPVPPAVELKGVVALLGRFPALAGCDLRVAPGEIVLIRGSNGAGKTTLLRVCAGLVPVVEGSAVVLGVDLVADRDAVRGRVGLVGHASGLYGDLSVKENVEFFAAASGMDSGDARDALDRMAVPRRLQDVAVDSLSAGQKKRVSFAAMLCRRPELWLLDEPHSGLDESARGDLDAMLGAAAAAGATVLMASHELDRAGVVATRSVEISGGTSSGGPSSGGTAQ